MRKKVEKTIYFRHVDSLKPFLFYISCFFAFFDEGNNCVQVLKLWHPFSPHTEQALLFDNSSAITSTLGLNLEKNPNPLVVL